MKDFFQYREELIEALDPRIKRLEGELRKIGNQVAKLRLPKDQKKYSELDKKQDALIRQIEKLKKSPQSASKKLMKSPKSASKVVKKKEIKKGWVSEPPKGDAKITRLFGKKINLKRGDENGYLTGGIGDLISLYAQFAIDYEGDGEDNEREFRRDFADDQWHNVRRDMRSSISGAAVLQSSNTTKKTKITVGEAGSYYEGGGYTNVYYIYIGNMVNADEPDLILCSSNDIDPKKIASTVERLLFDGHKSVKGVKI